MRTRLGSAHKSPIEKLQIGIINNILAVIGVLLAFVLIYFGGHLAVRIINFLSHESQAGFVLDPNSQEVLIAKGVIAALTAFFMLKK